MPELKRILKAIVADMEKSAIALVVLNTGVSPELAVLPNKKFYADLREQIDALK